MMVAAGVILAAVLGVFIAQKRSLEELELQEVADEIAKRVNDVSSVNAETSVNMTFNENKASRGEGILLRDTIGGKDYEIELTPNMVIIRQDGRVATAKFDKSVHVWDPEVELNGRKYTNQSELDEIDSEHIRVKKSSGYDFTIERKQLTVDKGSRGGVVLEYHTFVYFTM
jgi:hypothetical protein